MKIDWEKVVTQAITTLVVAVFMGAAVIVWRGATSVDTKVQQTRDDMQHLISALSDKLAGYEVQLVTISNQLATVLKNQTNFGLARVAASDGRTAPPSVALERDVQQKAASRDIFKMLQQQPAR